ncbi:MAG: cbb3-type cytochrome oxidase assembly protein CcoS [Sulfuricurvum sp.]|nr:cbb3-type cytochrome oxidase assembly protein CcoS [Sulfuricurvum sp.]
MDAWVIAMMLGASLLLGGVALIAFLWGIKNGQFDDEFATLGSPLRRTSVLASPKGFTPLAFKLFDSCDVRSKSFDISI